MTDHNLSMFVPQDIPGLFPSAKLQTAGVLMRTPITRIAVMLVLFWMACAATAQPACRVMVHGDSLSAAYGLKREEGWVSLLQDRLLKPGNGHPACEVVNTSISGETTAGGLSRLSPLLQRHRPTHVLIELGANDGLRGLKTEVMQDNLQQMITQSRQAGAHVLLVGIRIPPNYGKAYQDRFDAAFVNVASATQIARVPTLLNGFETDRSAFQADGIHPTAAVQPRMLDNVWPLLLKLF